MSGTGEIVREANSIVVMLMPVCLFSPAAPAGRPITLGQRATAVAPGAGSCTEPSAIQTLAALLYTKWYHIQVVQHCAEQYLPALYCHVMPVIVTGMHIAQYQYNIRAI